MCMAKCELMRLTPSAPWKLNFDTSFGYKGTCSPPATPHLLQYCIAWKIQNSLLRTPKWPWGFRKGFLGCFRQLSQNKFLDSSSPSMRKVDNGGKRKGRKRGKKEIDVVNSGRLRHCKLTAWTATDYTADRFCQYFIWAFVEEIFAKVLSNFLIINFLYT